MIRNAQPPESPPIGRSRSSTTATGVYDRDFWFCYASNTMLMIAVSLLFRYSDFVTHLGGSERHLGVIAGIGMVGALAVRIALGKGIDRYGPRHIWLGSLLLFIVAALAHTTVHTVDGPMVYLVRILLTIGIAGGVGASLTYVSLRVPENRIAEMVGTIGTSGFLGLAIGPVLGDLLFRTPVVARQQVDRMFLLAAVAGAIALVAAALATKNGVRKRSRRRHPPFLPLVRRYQPGVILFVAFAMGLGIGLPGVFVRAYAAELSIVGIQTYFLVYAIVAFVVRVATRRLTEQIGIRTVILTGLVGLSMSMILYLVVRQSWQLAIPAAVAGFAHALLFPAVVAGGSRSFPIRYRGLATTLVLGMFDLGNLIGQPVVGNTLYYAGRFGWPKYPTMFVLVAFFILVVGFVYARFARPAKHGQRARAGRPHMKSPSTRDPRRVPQAPAPADAPGKGRRIVRRY